MRGPAQETMFAANRSSSSTKNELSMLSRSITSGPLFVTEIVNVIASPGSRPIVGSAAKDTDMSDGNSTMLPANARPVTTAVTLSENKTRRQNLWNTCPYSNGSAKMRSVRARYWAEQGANSLITASLSAGQIHASFVGELVGLPVRFGIGDGRGRQHDGNHLSASGCYRQSYRPNCGNTRDSTGRRVAPRRKKPRARRGSREIA